MSEPDSAPITAVISGQILAARTAQGSTRDEVAAAARDVGAPASFTAAALRNLESGRRTAGVDELLWLAAALGVPVRRLLGEYADRFGADPDVPAPRAPEDGAVEYATREAVRQLGELTGQQPALAEAAYRLAGEMDNPGEKSQPAQVSRELRATLQAIWDAAPPPADEDDDLGPE